MDDRFVYFQRKRLSGRDGRKEQSSVNWIYKYKSKGHIIYGLHVIAPLDMFATSSHF
jgi:hypothetical protein